MFAIYVILIFDYGYPTFLRTCVDAVAGWLNVLA